MRSADWRRLAAGAGAVVMGAEEDTTPNLPADAPWWARWMVANVKDCWKWASTWLIALAAAAPMLYENVGQLQALISPSVYHYIQSALVMLVFVGRIKKQP